MSKLMPAIFFGHGNPMNTLLNNDYTRGWAVIGTRVPSPKAVLCVSAHISSLGKAQKGASYIHLPIPIELGPVFFSSWCLLTSLTGDLILLWTKRMNSDSIHLVISIRPKANRPEGSHKSISSFPKSL